MWFLAGSVGNSVVNLEGSAELRFGSWASPGKRMTGEAEEVQSHADPSASLCPLLSCVHVIRRKALLEAGSEISFLMCQPKARGCIRWSTYIVSWCTQYPRITHSSVHLGYRFHRRHNLWTLERAVGPGTLRSTELNFLPGNLSGCFAHRFSLFLETLGETEGPQ